MKQRDIALLQDLKASAKHGLPHLTLGDAALPDFHEFLRRVERLLRRLRLKREQLRQTDRNAVEYPLQSSDGRIGAVRFDQRDR